MESMARDLANPLLGERAALVVGPRPRGQKFSGGARLGYRYRVVKSPARGSRRAAARTARVVAALSVAVAATAAAPAKLRVGSSGDYAPFSVGRGAAARGFDVELARAFAAERGLDLELVAFRWRRLERDLGSGRFDVAMSGVTVRPERSLAGRFSVPVAESGAVALARDPALHASLDALDDPEVRIGVNAGGHLERAARARFPRATLVAIGSNSAVAKALSEGLVDAVVSDTLEAPGWLAAAPGAGALGPFTRDRKAWLVRTERADLAAELDAWLLAREADGTLARLREKHLGDAAPRTATPLAALVAAVDERLALMPLVAAAKRRAGLPLEAPAREQEVQERGVAAARDAARVAGLAPPSDAAVRALFGALVAAAKDVQRTALQDEAAELEAELRPALLRIGERIAWLAVRLPPGLGEADVAASLREGVRAPGLGEPALRSLAAAIAELAKPRKENPHGGLRRVLRVARGPGQAG
jgi:cyclohexadienyl dehydratase